MSTPFDLPNPSSLEFVERLYAEYRRNPESVAPEWRHYFAALRDSEVEAWDGRLGPTFRPRTLFNPLGANGSAAAERVARLSEEVVLQDRVDQLIRAYRVRGHLLARLDPLGLPRDAQPELEPDFYGLTDADLDRYFSSRTMLGAPDELTLRGILERLRQTYCRSIGVQFMHIDDLYVKSWLQARMEGTQNRLALSRDEQVRILTKLTDATIFEEFIQKKYLGAKRFSLEGSETLLPLLDLAIEKAGDQGVEQVVMGMAHRGRLNVLANIIGKSPSRIFHEFEDPDPSRNIGRGDVKYHLGYSSDATTSSGRKVHLSLCFNPSHLEFVNPVAMGRVRAKQDRLGDVERTRAMCVLIHGDAAFAGEGIVQETLNLSQLAGYAVGGTVHVIINNQIGFTTGPQEGRSSLYASAIGRMLQIPIFHVNGEDPEAVAQVVRLALDFRVAFKRDVIIDMWGYRRYGHNESDEPAFTHPVMYEAIRRRKTVREGYLERLLEMGEISREEADRIAEERRAHLEHELNVARSPLYTAALDTLQGIWEGYEGGPDDAVKEPETTGLSREAIRELMLAQSRVPAGFQVHPKLDRVLQARREMAEGKREFDWASGEALAFAATAVAGYRVRLSGQDSGRGTFSHRHAVLHDANDGRRYVALQNLETDQGPVEIVNSPLSEAGVLGFDYGYSLDWPDGLVLWEAQFGDFVNAAQVIIDQFIVSAEDKWARLSGLVMLLPHGFEGQGPEHSSARLERFLELAAEDNIQVAQPTTPAQYFHLLRRQVVRPWRKPLVVMTPKSLLRHKACVSPIEEFETGRFQRIMPDVIADRVAPVRRILLCTGKVYFDLAERREALGRDDVAIIRVEQLYPLADRELGQILQPYPERVPVYWVQEEPGNMGAWRYLRVRFGDRLFGRQPFHGIHRKDSASPATGSHSSHAYEQDEILRKAFS
ncbi:MAG: 2-oxoglutarate dehydrogenase E1 component [Acidobacteria bacterium]|nr:2-oxoglutarate dehydrogenase E1 component [Acidobacteriota bacterium]